MADESLNGTLPACEDQHPTKKYPTAGDKHRYECPTHKAFLISGSRAAIAEQSETERAAIRRQIERQRKQADKSRTWVEEKQGTRPSKCARSPATALPSFSCLLS
jgi:hypothetical protein